jgi:hypothetical protein
MIERTEIIYSSKSIEEALLLRALLEERGIDAVVENELLQAATGGLPLGPTTSPQVRVAADQAQKARQVVKAFEQHQQAARTRPSEYAGDPQNDICAWPVCPECGRRRQTVCPICETLGDDFPLADANYGAAAHARGENGSSANGLTVLCHICDEPFTPEFFRRCSGCGHQYPDGRIVTPGSFAGERDYITPQAWLVLLGTLGIAAGVIAYFWWLTRTT